MRDDGERPKDLVDHEGWTDLGDNHAFKYFRWAPDRELNPQYEGIADVPRFGATVAHLKPDGSPCLEAVHFDLPEVHAVEEASKRYCLANGIPYGEHYPCWQVQSWEPLTLSPSLLCNPVKGGCGDHGFIKAGKWVRA